MESEKGLVKKEVAPSFIEKLMVNSESLEQIKEVGRVIIASGFCPDHFKSNNDAVGIVMCIEAGRQLGLTWMQSLSDLYPVKGRIGMMGSAARSLIFSSGVLDKWEELTEGDYPEDTYKHIIISKRKGLPGEFRSEFSVHDAKKAGLFGKDIYQRYGKRMLMWRNIGFHATDFYGDIMKGMKTVEELNDFDAITPGTETTVIKTEDGKEIVVKESAQKDSEKKTKSAADKIKFKDFAPVEATVLQPTVINESHPEEPVKEEQPKEQPPTPDDLDKKDTKELLAIVNADSDMIESNALIPGRNTQKKLLAIIKAHRDGRLTEYTASFLSDKKGQIEGVEQPGENADIKPNTLFDPGNAKSENKYKIEIPPFDKGLSREFSSRKNLFNILLSVEPKIDNPRFAELIVKTGLSAKYNDKEIFCRDASNEEVNLLLNAN